MTRILFICYGNICRSPMAQSVFTYLAREAGVQNHYIVDSAATSREELGNPPDYRAVRRLQKAGIPVIAHRARQITPEDYKKWDYIIVMEEENRHDSLRCFGEDPENKISLLLAWTGRAGNVADPWYSGNFEAAFKDIREGCQGLLRTLEQRK